MTGAVSVQLRRVGCEHVNVASASGRALVVPCPLHETWTQFSKVGRRHCWRKITSLPPEWCGRRVPRLSHSVVVKRKDSPLFEKSGAGSFCFAVTVVNKDLQPRSCIPRYNFQMRADLGPEMSPETPGGRREQTQQGMADARRMAGRTWWR